MSYLLFGMLCALLKLNYDLSTKLVRVEHAIREEIKHLKDR